MADAPASVSPALTRLQPLKTSKHWWKPLHLTPRPSTRPSPALPVTQVDFPSFDYFRSFQPMNGNASYKKLWRQGPWQTLPLLSVPPWPDSSPWRCRNTDGNLCTSAQDHPLGRPPRYLRRRWTSRPSTTSGASSPWTETPATRGSDPGSRTQTSWPSTSSTTTLCASLWYPTPTLPQPPSSRSTSTPAEYVTPAHVMTASGGCTITRSLPGKSTPSTSVHYEIL